MLANFLTRPIRLFQGFNLSFVTAKSLVLTFALASCTSTVGDAQAAPELDFSGTRETLAGDPTQILILGSYHINQLDEADLPIEDLDFLLSRLEAFAPDVIAIENQPGRSCEQLQRYESEYPGVWDTYCIDPSPALEGLQKSMPEAQRELSSLLASKAGAWTFEERRQLAVLFYAVGDPYSAVIHWYALPPEERRPEDGLSEIVLQELEKVSNARNESNSLGAVLAHRLNHDRVHPMDDHTADIVLARAPDNLFEILQSDVWGNAPSEAREYFQEGLDLLGSPEGVIRAYLHINGAKMQETNIAIDFAAAAAHSDVTRQYVAWWQARGLRMAAHVIEASGNQPGAKVLVIVGSSHKAYFEAYLDQMHDVQLVKLSDVLASGEID